MNSGATASPNALLILAAVVLLGGGAAFYFTSEPDDPTPVVDAETASSSTAPATTAPPTDTAAALIDAPPPLRPIPAPPPLSLLPKQERPGAQARSMIAAMRSGARAADMQIVFRAAEDFRAKGAGVDAHLLYFYAAKNGHPKAMFALASAQDPLHFDPGASAMDEPIPDQAHKWYRMAADAGVTAAEPRLQALKAWLARKAARGDDDARRLLERW